MFRRTPLAQPQVISELVEQADAQQLRTEKMAASVTGLGAAIATCSKLLVRACV